MPARVSLLLFALLCWATAASAAGRVERGVRINAAGPDGPIPVEQTIDATERHPRLLRNVREATLDIFQPEAAVPRGALVVCPGGAFRFLNIDEEGSDVARWVNTRGFVTAVLHYRLKPTPQADWLFFAQMLVELPFLLRGWGVDGLQVQAGPAIADAAAALRYMRERSTQWGFASDRVGIAGFSAGGIVAIGASLSADSRSRPDFTAAFYSGPVHIDSVPADAPPLLAAASRGDRLTAIATQPIAAAWAASGAPVELRLYEGGGHGFGGNQPQGVASDRWRDDFEHWLDKTVGPTS